MRLLPKSGQIDSGEILFYRDQETIDLTTLPPDGKVMRTLRGQSIGMVFQDPMSSLNPVYSIGYQISEKLRKHQNISKRDARDSVVSLLERLNIPQAQDRYHDYPHQFSGGMKQRVMIAIAMINNPRLLIADEPTTALDVTIQAQILSLLQIIQYDFQSAIILITHNMGIVAEVADEIAVMYMGRVVEKGNKRQIFKSATHPYTRALLRSVPVLGLGLSKKLVPIQGVTPDPRFLPKGCSFSPRCEWADDICRDVIPPDHVIDDGHCVACHHYREVIANGKAGRN
jgi:oligopeptide/dipeptide ABC transporter ATP-binding protein